MSVFEDNEYKLDIGLFSIKATRKEFSRSISLDSNLKTALIEFDKTLEQNGIKAVVDEILPQVTSTDYQKKQFLEYNDVTQDELIKNPRSIMPHFLVPGHPLSHKLLEEEKIGKSLVG